MDWGASGVEFVSFNILLRDLPTKVSRNLPELEKIVGRVWGDNREAETIRRAVALSIARSRTSEY